MWSVFLCMKGIECIECTKISLKILFPQVFSASENKKYHVNVQKFKSKLISLFNPICNLIHSYLKVHLPPPPLMSETSSFYHIRFTL